MHNKEANCTNIEGSYECICNEGYFGNGTVCEDNDECEFDSLNDCDINANCTNVPGNK